MDGQSAVRECQEEDSLRVKENGKEEMPLTGHLLCITRQVWRTGVRWLLGALFSGEFRACECLDLSGEYP
jgi:hypothetical protein